MPTDESRLAHYDTLLTNSPDKPESQDTPKSYSDYSAADLKKMSHEEAAKDFQMQGVEALNRAAARRKEKEAKS